MRCARCWKIYPEEDWPMLREQFDRTSMIEFIMEIWSDLSDEEQHEWALEWLEQSSKEKLVDYCRELGT